MKDEVKFLGLIFDKKFNFNSHICYLKKKCRKSLNFLRVVGHTDWGADKSTLLKALSHPSQVKTRPRQCPIWLHKELYFKRTRDPIHHQCLRIALGAFRTSPVQSLYAEAGEPSLKHRRLRLPMNFYVKLKSLSENLCYDLVSSPPLSDLFQRSKTVPPFGTRILPHIVEADSDGF